MPYFSPLKQEDPTPLPVADYLELEAIARRGKTPFVSVPAKNNKNEESETIRLRVAPALITATEERLQAWRTLQELAGLVTPFTADVEARLKQEIADAHQAELAAVKQEYEARIDKLRAEMETEMAARVKESFMNLAGYNK